MKSNGPYLRNHHQREDLSRSARTKGRTGQAATKLLQVIGLFILGSIAILQQDCWSLQAVNGSRLHQKESSQVLMLTQEEQSEQQQLEAKSEQKEQGIFEKAMNKLEQKEQEERDLKDEQFLIKQQNFIKATRQAMLLASQSSDLDDVQQVMKNMRMGDTRALTTVTYDDRVKQIAEQQPEYKDEYEGFGSLTEMIKNQDKLADKELQEEEKKNSVEKLKAKLTEALSKKSQPKTVLAIAPMTMPKPIEETKQPEIKEQTKKEELNTQQKTISSKVNETTSSQQQPTTNKVAETNQKPADANSTKGEEQQVNNVTTKTTEEAPQEDNSSKQQAQQAPEEGQKNLTQLPALTAVAKLANSSSPQPKPIIPQTALAENKNNNTIVAVEKTNQQSAQAQAPQPADQQQNQTDQQQNQTDQPQSQNSSAPTTLYDSSVSQVIDEVQNEQDAQQVQEKESNSDPTTIEDDSLQVQVESQIANQPKKSMMQRFTDQVNQDEADNQKTQELVNKMERKMNKKKRNVLDQESERLIREQDEELQLEQDLNSNSLQVVIQVPQQQQQQQQ